MKDTIVRVRDCALTMLCCHSQSITCKNLPRKARIYSCSYFAPSVLSIIEPQPSKVLSSFLVIVFCFSTLGNDCCIRCVRTTTALHVSSY